MNGVFLTSSILLDFAGRLDHYFTMASDDTNGQASSLRPEIIGDTQRWDFEKEKGKRSCVEGNKAGGASAVADSTEGTARRATDG
jgi:hypothetical protein